MFKEVKLTERGKALVNKVEVATDELLSSEFVCDLSNSELEMLCNTLKALVSEKFSDKKTDNALKGGK